MTTVRFERLVSDGGRPEIDGDQVSWHSFRQPHRPDRDYSGFGPFRFDAAAYRAALSEMTQ